MAPTSLLRHAVRGADRVRDHLLTSLHLGRLAPGDRVASVRRLADMTGLNRKTIHRAYRELVREGLLQSRPGSGTFISPGSAPGDRLHERTDLLGFLERGRREASRLGMSLAEYAAFVDLALGDGLRGVPVAVVECNAEQTSLISEDLRRGLGVEPRAVALSSLRRGPGPLLGARAIVTTDCHLPEVTAAAAPTGLAVFRVALDGEFPRRVMRRLRRGSIVLVVRDAAFDRPFRRLLEQLGAPPESLARLEFATPATVAAALAAAGREAVVCLSPAIEAEVRGHLPVSQPRIADRWSVPAESLDRLRAELARGLGASWQEALRPSRGA